MGLTYTKRLDGLDSVRVTFTSVGFMLVGTNRPFEISTDCLAVPLERSSKLRWLSIKQIVREISPKTSSSCHGKATGVIGFKLAATFRESGIHTFRC